MIPSGSGKQKGAIIQIVAGAIIIVQLLQMAVLHNIKGGLEPDYSSH
jgi:hypothetical protein